MLRALPNSHNPGLIGFRLPGWTVNGAYSARGQSQGHGTPRVWAGLHGIAGLLLGLGS